MQTVAAQRLGTRTSRGESPFGDGSASACTCDSRAATTTTACRAASARNAGGGDFASGSSQSGSPNHTTSPG
jgi:hypothetical protein